MSLLLLLVGVRGAAIAAAPSSTSVARESSDATLTPARVLVLYPDNRMLAANILFDRTFRQRLSTIPGTPIDCFGEYLDEVSFPVKYQERMRDFLRTKYEGHTPDVIVAFAPPSFEFCSRYCSEIFPGVPLVFAAIDADTSVVHEPGLRATGVRSNFDLTATLRLALQLHPRTRQVYLVADSTKHDSAGAVLGSTQREPEVRATFHYLPSQPLSEFLHALSELPESSLVIDLSIFGRSSGSTVPPEETEQWMARLSPAPVYAACDPLVGYGLVGSVTTPIGTISLETADMVAQILHRPNADELPAVRTLAAAPIFDWRQLRHWGIKPRQLPANSIVQFKPPSLWQQYSIEMIIGGTLFLVQTWLIVALAVQGRRRRFAEQEARGRNAELMHTTRVATLGELTASLAHEINQPLAAILSNAQAALRQLASGKANIQEIGEILTDIANDDRRAGEVIRRMRSLLRKEERAITVIDLNELVAEVAEFMHSELVVQNISLVLELSTPLPPVHGERIQLQQVMLNLMMNAIDAVKHETRGSRRIIIRTVTVSGQSAQVSIQDFGAGVPADQLEQIFEPFITTKVHGLGMGLSICRSIIHVHGGRIGCTNNPRRGATFWFILPGAEEAQR